MMFCMSGMVVAATGDPDRFEQPPLGEGADQRYAGEDRADGEMLRRCGVQPEQRKHQRLRRDRDPEANRDIGDGLDLRHGARLFHAASALRVAVSASKLAPVSAWVAVPPVISCQRRTATSQ